MEPVKPSCKTCKHWEQTSDVYGNCYGINLETYIVTNSTNYCRFHDWEEDGDEMDTGA